MSFSLVWIIIGVCALISYDGFQNEARRQKFLFAPYLISKGQNYFSIFSHSWYHADWQHLLFNMFSLFALGGALESFWIQDFGSELGLIYFILLYFIGGIAATILPYFRHSSDPSYRSLGASGAVSAVIFACIMWNPQMELMIMFIPIPIPAFIFGPIYLAIEYYAMHKGKGNIANDGHISGALFGILFVLFLNLNKGKQFLDLLFSYL